MKTFVIAVIIFLLAGCTPSLPAEISQRPNLGVSNGSTLTVTLVVNGRRVADYPAGGPYPTIDTTELPELPWEVQARSRRPAGCSPRCTSHLVRFGAPPVQKASSRSREAWGGSISRAAASGSGGDFAPSGPVPAESPGTPGDCEP